MTQLCHLAWQLACSRARDSRDQQHYDRVHQQESQQEEGGECSEDIDEKRSHSHGNPSIPRLHLLAIFSYLAYALVPSFLRPSQDANERSKPLSPTAFLDGLRGVAAFFVFNQHLIQPFTSEVFQTYGHEGTGNWIQLPFLRLWYAGAQMVFIFFIVSGYALSYNCLKARRDRGWEELLPSLSSSTFRRAMRLFLPSLFISFVFMTLVYLGVCEPVRAFAEDPDMITGWADRFPDRKESYLLQVADWINMWYNMANVFWWGIYWPTYDDHLWTIRVEFMGSMVLYLTVLMLARAKSLVRLSILVVLMLFSIIYGRWEVWMFLAGIFIAEIDVTRNVDRNKDENSSANLSGLVVKPRRRFTVANSLWVANLIVGLYLLSMPMNNADSTPGYIWLDSLIPPSFNSGEQRVGFWWGFGAMQLLLTTSNCPSVAKTFTNPLSQYLGRISYSLYVLHGPLILTLGYGVAQVLVPVLGTATILTWTLVVALEWIVVLPVLIILADLFWRAIDVKSVEFAHWVQIKSFLAREKSADQGCGRGFGHMAFAYHNTHSVRPRHTVTYAHGRD